MYIGFGSLEKKLEVISTILEHYQCLGLLTNEVRLDINLEEKDLSWLEQLVNETQKIIDFYKQKEDQNLNVP